jgi:hypothetical protein
MNQIRLGVLPFLRACILQFCTKTLGYEEIKLHEIKGLS